VLSQAEIDSFATDGFVAVRGAVPADVLRLCQEEIWSALGEHIEGSFEVGGDWWVNFRSRARGLLALYLFSDVDAASAPTRVRPGSHRDAARVLAPAGDEGMPFPQAARLAAQASAARPTELATGQAGDVIVCHPFAIGYPMPVKTRCHHLRVSSCCQLNRRGRLVFQPWMHRPESPIRQSPGQSPRQ
jgi:hypothetical protein